MYNRQYMADFELSEPTQGFDAVKKISPKNGVEYWHAREIMSLLGYTEWRNFQEVIKKAKRACLASGQQIENHFVDVNKMVKIGSKSMREVTDYKLDRYACYLIAQNGDSKKTPIAIAQTYFAMQTRKQEIFQELADTERRLLIREEMKDENKKLFSTAKKSGVENFGVFNDAGYLGLYEMPLRDVEKVKGIKRGELLDRAGSTELAANLFRITQTEGKLRKDKVQGGGKANEAHFQVGRRVRQTIKEIGGVLPERLKAEKHIKIVEKELRAVGAYDETIKRIGQKRSQKELSEERSEN